jgi:hypothetical protein
VNLILHDFCVEQSPTCRERRFAGKHTIAREHRISRRPPARWVLCGSRAGYGAARREPTCAVAAIFLRRKDWGARLQCQPKSPHP